MVIFRPSSLNFHKSAINSFLTCSAGALTCNAPLDGFAGIIT